MHMAGQEHLQIKLAIHPPSHGGVGSLALWHIANDLQILYLAQELRNVLNMEKGGNYLVSWSQVGFSQYNNSENILRIMLER